MGVVLAIMANKHRDMVVRRIYRQHNSLVLTVPELLRLDWDLRPGDYLAIEKKRGSALAQISKLRRST